MSTSFELVHLLQIIVLQVNCLSLFLENRSRDFITYRTCTIPREFCCVFNERKLWANNNYNLKIFCELTLTASLSHPYTHTRFFFFYKMNLQQVIFKESTYLVS